jgi:hypothetical protein
MYSICRCRDWRCLVIVLAGLLAWPWEIAFTSPVPMPATQPVVNPASARTGLSHHADRRRQAIDCDPADNQLYEDALDRQDDARSLADLAVTLPAWRVIVFLEYRSAEFASPAPVGAIARRLQPLRC